MLSWFLIFEVTLILMRYFELSFKIQSTHFVNPDQDRYNLFYRVRNFLIKIELSLTNVIYRFIYSTKIMTMKIPYQFRNASYFPTLFFLSYLLYYLLYDYQFTL